MVKMGNGFKVSTSRFYKKVITMKTICTTRVTYVMTGYGDLTLTDEALYWNKSASSFLVFGAVNAMTDSHFYLPLSDIASVSSYIYFPGGGLCITDVRGKLYKFSFKKKKDFVVIHDYLTELKEKQNDINQQS